MKKIKFLKELCPFTILENEVTWEEFIITYAKGTLTAIMFYSFYICFIAANELIGG